MARFTYIEEQDSDGRLLGTTILETGGYFAGYSPAELEPLAENHYPKYTSGNLSETFSLVYFNHTLRSKLNDKTSLLSDDVQPDTSLRGTPAGQSDSHSSGQSEDGHTDRAGD